MGSRSGDSSEKLPPAGAAEKLGAAAAESFELGAVDTLDIGGPTAGTAYLTAYIWHTQGLETLSGSYVAVVIVAQSEEATEVSACARSFQAA